MNDLNQNIEGQIHDDDKENQSDDEHANDDAANDANDHDDDTNITAKFEDNANNVYCFSNENHDRSNDTVDVVAALDI